MFARQQDAYRCFMGTNMDALVLENVLLLKEEQAAAIRVRGRELQDNPSRSIDHADVD